MSDNSTTLQFLLKTLEANHKWHQDYDDHGGYPGSELEASNVQAISTVRAAIAASTAPTGKVVLPPAAKLRRQARPDGGYDMVPAYTTEEVLAILARREAGHDEKRRAAFSAGRAQGMRDMQCQAVQGEKAGVHDFASQPSAEESLAALVANQQARKTPPASVARESVEWPTPWITGTRGQPNLYSEFQVRKMLAAHLSPSPLPQVEAGKVAESPSVWQRFLKYAEKAGHFAEDGSTRDPTKSTTAWNAFEYACNECATLASPGAAT